MKLAVTDNEPFAALNPLEVRAYLLAGGWSEVRVLPGRGSFLFAIQARSVANYHYPTTGPSETSRIA